MNEFAITACDWINFEQSDLKKTMEMLLKDPQHARQLQLRDLDVRTVYYNEVDPITLPKSVIMDANCFMLQDEHKTHEKM